MYLLQLAGNNATAHISTYFDVATYHWQITRSTNALATVGLGPGGAQVLEAGWRP